MDYVEDAAGQLRAWEFKWSEASKARFPLTFRNAYPEAVTQIVHPGNFEEFVFGGGV